MKNKHSKGISAVVVMLTMMMVLPMGLRVRAETLVRQPESIDFPLLETSMGITIPNVDLDKVPDDRPISEKDKQALLEAYPDLKPEQLKDMTIQEMNDLQAQQKVDPEQVKSMYPELKDKDINHWTYADFDAYVESQNNVELDTDIFRNRGITDQDVKYLLKEYQTLDNLATQSDEIIRNYLEEFYAQKLDFAQRITSFKELKR